MNQFVGHITDFFWNLDKKQFNQIAIGVLSTSLVIFIGGLYWQHRRTKSFKAEMITVNNSRMRVKEILDKNELIKMQQHRAEEILDKDTKFFLEDYFDKLIKSMQLQSNVKLDIPITQDLENEHAEGYVEVHIDAEFFNINMKQLVNLLQELEKNERIVIRKLEITKPGPQPTINVVLTISTVQHKMRPPQSVEAE